MNHDLLEDHKDMWWMLKRLKNKTYTFKMFLEQLNVDFVVKKNS